jgi:hypothetical protein
MVINVNEMFILDNPIFCKTRVPRILNIAAVFINIPTNNVIKLKGLQCYQCSVQINEGRKFRSSAERPSCHYCEGFAT